MRIIKILGFKRYFFVALALFICLAVPTSDVFAGKLVDVAVDPMISESSAVVVATVVSVDPNYGSQVGYPATSYRLGDVDVLRGGFEGHAGDSGLLLVQRGGFRSDESRLAFSTTTELRKGVTYLLVLRDHFFVSPFFPASDAVLERVSVDGSYKARTRGGQLVKIHTLLGIQHLRSSTDLSLQSAASDWEDVVEYVRERAKRLVLDGGRVSRATFQPVDVPTSTAGSWSLVIPYNVGLGESVEEGTLLDQDDRVCDGAIDDAGGEHGLR